jgi:hypothetical protein
MTNPPNTTGFDACVDTSPYAAGLNAASITFVWRYAASGPSNEWKEIQQPEAILLGLLGINLAIVWETTANRSLSGAMAGTADGEDCKAFMLTVGLPPGLGCIVCPTTDMDIAESQYDAVKAYYAAFAAALGAGYQIGCYGSGYLINKLKNDGVIVLRWETQSMGFDDSAADAAAGDYDVIQRAVANLTVNGGVINVDPDSLHTPTVDVGARLPFNGCVPKNATFNAAINQVLLNKAGQTPPLGIDDASGNATNVALKAWLAKNGFPELAWGGAVEALLKQAGVAIYNPGDAPKLAADVAAAPAKGFIAEIEAEL